ncbi:MAG: hypothetical protein ACTHMZ_02405 [Actinomycetes bacterium]
MAMPPLLGLAVVDRVGRLAGRAAVGLRRLWWTGPPTGVVAVRESSDARHEPIRSVPER